MIHLIKLAVGIRDAGHLAAVQAERAARQPPLRHHTRNFPRRAAELCESGSIYWVIGGVITTRQRVLDVINDKWDDGTPCTGLVLDTTLVPVSPRSLRPFQGWRYLPPADAPADLPAGAPETTLPPELLRNLRELALI